MRIISIGVFTFSETAMEDLMVALSCTLVNLCVRILDSRLLAKLLASLKRLACRDSELCVRVIEIVWASLKLAAYGYFLCCLIEVSG